MRSHSFKNSFWHFSKACFLDTRYLRVSGDWMWGGMTRVLCGSGQRCPFGSLSSSLSIKTLTEKARKILQLCPANSRGWSFLTLKDSGQGSGTRVCDFYCNYGVFFKGKVQYPQAENIERKWTGSKLSFSASLTHLNEWVFKSFCQLALEMKFDIIKIIQYATII